MVLGLRDVGAKGGGGAGGWNEREGMLVLEKGQGNTTLIIFT